MNEHNEIQDKPIYGSNEYNRNAVKKHYREHGGKEKSRIRYYSSLYGKDVIMTYREKYGDDYITMLKIHRLKLKLSDSSSETSREHGSLIG